MHFKVAFVECTLIRSANASEESAKFENTHTYTLSSDSVLLSLKNILSSSWSSSMHPCVTLKAEKHLIGYQIVWRTTVMTVTAR